MRARVRRFLDGEGTRYLIVAMACAALALFCTAVAFAQYGTEVTPSGWSQTTIGVGSDDYGVVDCDEFAPQGCSPAETGTWMWYAGSNFGNQDRGHALHQRFETDEGEVWSFHGFAENGSSFDAEGTLVLRFLDGGLSELTREEEQVLGDTSWTEFTINSATAPASTVWVEARIEGFCTSGISCGQGDWTFWDSLVLCNCAVAPSYPGDGQNVLVNPGFEEVLSGGATPTPTPTAEPSGYQYITTVTATLATSASDQTDVAVQFPINALNLTDSGYLDDDGQGILVIGGASSSAVLPTVHTGVNQASWWIPFTGTTSGGETRSADIYTSGDPNPGRPQSLWLENASESVDVVHDASFNITDELTIDLGAFETTTLPSSDVCLLCKDSQWDITLNGATLTVDIETAAGTETLTHTGIAVDTPYNVKVTFDDGEDLGLFIDGELVSSSLGLSTTLATTTNDIEISAFTGWMGRARVGGTSVSSPTYVLDLQFEPTHLTQTDAGDAGDGWTWEGTVEDQSASDNDGTYLFVRDMSLWSRSVGSLSATNPPSADIGTDSEDFPDAVTGNPDDPFGDSFDDTGAEWRFPLSFFDGLVGDTDNGQPPDILIAAIFSAAAAFLGFSGSFGATRIVGYATVVGSISSAAMAYFTPFPLIIIVVTAVLAAIMLTLIDEPFTAR